jgi:D-alanyl-D-alanine carboxypeptidase (penicillin-binding protein 5/6)
VVALLKKIICFVLAFIFFLFLPLPVYADSKPQVSAKAAVLMNADSGEFLYAKDENERLCMASTTKIMTALITLEEAAVNNRIITITKEMVQVEGSSMGLLPGDQVTLKSLAVGMLTVSGNDAANSAAIAISGSLERFARRMNQRAKDLRLNDTHFVTPSGLDDKEHYTTAHDLAVLAAAAMKNPDFAEIAGSRSMDVQYINPEYTRRFTNHNKLLSMYEGCIGVKTGFTKKAGRCLVSAAQRDGVRLIAVTLNAPDDWNDHQKLLDYGFSKLTSYAIDDSEFSTSVAVVGGLKESVDVCGTAGTNVVLDSEESLHIKRTVELPKFLYAPVEEGQVVGTVRYTLDSKTIAQTDITAKEKVEKKEAPENPFQIFLDRLKKLFLLK